MFGIGDIQPCPQLLRRKDGGERPALSAHRCQIEERGQAWGGTERLSGAAFIDDERALRVWIRDPESAPEDQLQLWLMNAEGVLQQASVRAGRVTGDRALRQQLRARWIPQEKGHLIRLELPQNTRKIALRAEAHAPERSGSLGLWIAGGPGSGGGPRLVELP